MKSVLEFCGKIRVHGRRDAEPNARGNTIYRIHHGSDRYPVDFCGTFKEEGWEQFDTHQDAHYFGVWVNKLYLMTLSYCEGDWCLVDCPTEAHYFAEVRDAIAFYGEGKIADVYSMPEKPGQPVVHVAFHQDRQLFLEPYGSPSRQLSVLDALA